jgi:hypothetical protein
MDLTTKDDREIEIWIANHERKPGATELPFYRQLLEERARRAQQKQRLIFDRSLEALTKAAIAQTCITYGDLAKASGVEWSQARHQMNGPAGHLDRLLDLCHARNLPLLTAICVNQDGVTARELEEKALAGFVAGARRLGLSVTSERAFHHKCRDECWAWGREQSKRGSE